MPITDIDPWAAIAFLMGTVYVLVLVVLTLGSFWRERKDAGR